MAACQIDGSKCPRQSVGEMAECRSVRVYGSVSGCRKRFYCTLKVNTWLHPELPGKNTGMTK